MPVPAQVLGTLITEWDDGRTKCEIFLQTEESAQQAACQLAAIAVYFGFDGWLLNIENELDASFMPNLLLFIRCALLLPSGVCWMHIYLCQGLNHWHDPVHAHVSIRPVQRVLPSSVIRPLLVLLQRDVVQCRTLRAAMQKQCSRGQVNWYDAVTTEGKLVWQNSLNALNRRFFDACDAIFVNYAWKVIYT